MVCSLFALYPGNATTLITLLLAILYSHTAMLPVFFFQKSLKFTTLIHSLVTRYGPQLKPHVPVLRTAVGRCFTFMVKAVLAALQRLEK